MIDVYEIVKNIHGFYFSCRDADGGDYFNQGFILTMREAW